MQDAPNQAPDPGIIAPPLALDTGNPTNLSTRLGAPCLPLESPAISVGGVRRVRGLVVGAKRGRAEVPQGRCAAGRAAFTELTQ